MIETKEKTIDGRKITVTQFPGRRGLKLKTRLAKLLGPTIFTALKSVSGKSENILDKDINLETAAGAIEKLLERIDENIWEALVFELLSMTRINGQEVTSEIFDVEFAGSFVTLYKILAFILEVNYKDFLGLTGIGLSKPSAADSSVSKNI